MRIVILLLLLSVLLTGPLSAPILWATGAPSPDNPVIVTGDLPTEPSTLLDGIDWDEWFENLLEGIDWDEWFESIGLSPATTT